MLLANGVAGAQAHASLGTAPAPARCSIRPTRSPTARRHQQQQQQQQQQQLAPHQRQPLLLRASAQQEPVAAAAGAPAATPAAGPPQNKGPASRLNGRMTYRPESFAVIVNDAVLSVADGIAAGLTRMEVEFPPVPVQLDGYKGASDLFVDANIQLALAGARTLAASGRNVHVVMPDQGEYNRAYKMCKPTLELSKGVTIGHLKEGLPKGFSIDFVSGLLQEAGPDSTEAGKQADTYILINASCVELPFVKDYVERMSPEGSGKVSVLWNLELESLRGDLGLLGLPPKDIHLQFLSRFRPVFYLRTRDYSKSVQIAPFIVNYSGALFREFPGPWQVMLKQDSGEYACIAEDPTRYNLGELKEELQRAMGLDTEADGSMAQVLRRGLKSSTWWEDEYDTEASHEWRL